MLARIHVTRPLRFPVADRCHFSESRVTQALVSRTLHNAREQKDPTHFISVSFLTDVDCGQWLRLPCPLLLIFFRCLLPRCSAASFHHSKPIFTCLLAARTACDKKPRHILEVLFGPASPPNSERQSTSGQAALVGSQMAPRSTWVGQPYQAEAEPAGRAEHGYTHDFGGR